MCILGMRATSCCSLETQKTDANGNVKGEDNVEDLSNEEEDSSNEANEDVAAETEDNAEDGTNEAAGNRNIIVSGLLKMLEYWKRHTQRQRRECRE